MDETPPIISQIKSLTTAAAQFAITGFKTVPSEIFEQRLSICKACPYWRPEGFAGLGKCAVCGCSVGKLKLPMTRCPDSPPRWVQYRIETPTTASSA